MSTTSAVFVTRTSFITAAASMSSTASRMASTLSTRITTTAASSPSSSSGLPLPSCAIDCVSQYLPPCVTEGLNCICPKNSAGTRVWFLGSSSGPEFGTCLISTCDLADANTARGVLFGFCGFPPHTPSSIINDFESLYGTPTGSVSSSTSAADSSGSGGLSSGAAAGIGIGVAIIVLLLAGLFILFFRRRRNDNHRAPSDDGKHDELLSPPMSMAAKVSDQDTRPPTASTAQGGAGVYAYHEVHGQDAAKELPTIPHHHVNAHAPTELPAENKYYGQADVQPPAYVHSPAEMASPGTDKAELPVGVAVSTPVSPEEKWEQP